MKDVLQTAAVFTSYALVVGAVAGGALLFLSAFEPAVAFMTQYAQNLAITAEAVS